MNNENKKITFWGVELNEEEIKYHRLSYYTVSKQFDAVLCNNITEVDPSIWDNFINGELTTYYKNGEEITREQYEEETEEIQNAIDDLTFEEWQTEEQETKAQKRIEELEKRLKDYETCEEEIYQYYIVSDNALWYLERMNQIVFYSEKLDCYIWGVTHWGTSWDYVLTNLTLNEDFTALE